MVTVTQTWITSGEGEILKTWWGGAAAGSRDPYQAFEAWTSKSAHMTCKVPPLTPMKKLTTMCKAQWTWKSRWPLFGLLYIHTGDWEMSSCSPSGSWAREQGVLDFMEMELWGKERMKQHIPPLQNLQTLIIHFPVVCGLSQTLRKVNPTDSCTENKKFSLVLQKKYKKQKTRKQRRNRCHPFLQDGKSCISWPTEKKQTLLWERKEESQSK